MKKYVALLLMVVMTFGMFAGCSNGETAPAAETPSTESNGEAADSEEVVTIEYWQYFYETKVNLVDELITEFEAANPGIKVEHKHFPYDNYQQKLAASIATGQGPNIINLYYGWVPKYVQSGVLQELPGTLATSIENDFAPMVGVNKIEGKFYTIPIAVRTSALFYNLDILGEYGYTAEDVPQDLETLVAMAEEMTVWNGDELIQEGMTWQPTGQYHSWLRPVLMKQFGGEPMSADKKTAQWNSEAGLEAFKFFLSLTQDKKIGVTDFYTDDVTAFMSGKAAFHIDGSYRLGTLRKKAEDLNWGVAKLPAHNGVQTSFGSFWTNGITASTTGKELEASEKFLAFMTSEDVMKRWTTEIGELGARKSITKDEELLADEALRPFIEQLPTATSYFYVDESADRQALLDAIDQVLLNGMDPKDALDQANATVQAMLDEYWAQ